jgi:hypothetical protein
VKALLQRSDSDAPAFYCGYVTRCLSNIEIMFATAEEMGFEAEILGADFLPDPPPENAYSSRPLNIGA